RIAKIFDVVADSIGRSLRAAVFQSRFFTRLVEDPAEKHDTVSSAAAPQLREVARFGFIHGNLVADSKVADRQRALLFPHLGSIDRAVPFLLKPAHLLDAFALEKTFFPSCFHNGGEGEAAAVSSVRSLGKNALAGVVDFFRRSGTGPGFV